MTLKAPWQFGTIVYIRVEPEPIKGMVTGYYFPGSGECQVAVTWPNRCETRHYAFELSTEHTPDYGVDE